MKVKFSIAFEKRSQMYIWKLQFYPQKKKIKKIEKKYDTTQNLTLSKQENIYIYIKTHKVKNHFKRRPNKYFD